MKLIKLNCPYCGANIKLNSNVKVIQCEYCEAEIYVDNEVKRQELTINNNIKIDGIKTNEDKISLAKKYIKAKKYDSAIQLAKEVLNDDQFNLDALILYLDYYLIYTHPLINENYDYNEINEYIKFLEIADEKKLHTKKIANYINKLNYNELIIYMNSLDNKTIKLLYEKYNYQDEYNPDTNYSIYFKEMKNNVFIIEEKNFEKTKHIVTFFIAFLFILLTITIVWDTISIRIKESKYNYNIHTNSDESLSIGNQHFDIIEQNINETILLSKFNLEVGETCYNNDTEYLECEKIKNPSNIQKNECFGYYKNLTMYNCIVEYETLNSNKNIYLNSYKKYLEKKYDLKIKEIRIPTYEELKYLNDDVKYRTSYYADLYHDSNINAIFKTKEEEKIYIDQNSHIATLGIRVVIVIDTEIIP